MKKFCYFFFFFFLLLLLILKDKIDKIDIRNIRRRDLKIENKNNLPSSFSSLVNNNNHSHSHSNSNTNPNTNSNTNSNNNNNDNNNNEELCTEKKLKSFILKNGEFITKDEFQWLKRKDESMEYKPKLCKLKRFTHNEALKCLNNRHILFIGDSLSRFQYLSLTYFIEHGKWLSRFRMDPNCPYIDEFNNTQCRKGGEPNLNDPHMRHYKELHVGLGSHYFNGRLECQCYRGQQDRSVEDMYYENLVNSSLQLKLTYMSDNIVFPMKGWKRSFCSKNSSCNMNETNWYEFSKMKWDYEYYDDNPLLYNYISKYLIPDVKIILVNRGLWTGIPTNFSTMLKIFPEISKITKQNSGRCFWKGTTLPMEPKSTELLGYRPLYPSNFSILEKEIRHLGSKYSCESFDLSHVTSHFVDMLGSDYHPKNNLTWNSNSKYKVSDIYIDRVHFQPWVYEEFNQILLNVLC